MWADRMIILVTPASRLDLIYPIQPVCRGVPQLNKTVFFYPAFFIILIHRKRTKHLICKYMSASLQANIFHKYFIPNVLSVQMCD